MSIWMKIGCLTIAGGCGAVARWFVSGLMQGLMTRLGGEVPIGTLSVNVIGCLLFGLVFALGESRAHLSQEAQFILLTGFMGAFTTFSTFAFEANNIYRDFGLPAAALHLTAHNGFGLFAVILGGRLGRMLVS